MREPTIWEALTVKLGREPTNAECEAEIKRILADVTAEFRAKRGRGKR